MSKFLRAAFKISLWEILVIVVFGAFKFTLTTYELAGNFARPFMWLCLGAGLLFIAAWGLIGVIENRYESIERWGEEARSSKKARFIAYFITWGQLIPTATGCFLFIYLIAPTTVSVFVAFIAGIILRNSIQFFQQRKTTTVQGAN